MKVCANPKCSAAVSPRIVPGGVPKRFCSEVCKNKFYSEIWQRAHPEEMRAYARRAQARYTAKFPDIVRARHRSHKLKKHAGISVADYDAMVAAQGGRCRICYSVPQRLVVDTDHTNGIVRGLLCDKCNRGLGLFGDQADTLRRAAEYVDKERAR